MNIAKKITMAAVAVSLMAGSAVAAPGGAQGKSRSVTRAEVLERAGERFDAADKNGDGVLDASEARAAFKERRGEKRDKMKERHPDREIREGAGKREGKAERPERQRDPITKAEMLKKAGERFDAADKDGDGVLSPEERRAAKKDRGDKMKERRSDRG